MRSNERSLRLSTFGGASVPVAKRQALEVLNRRFYRLKIDAGDDIVIINVFHRKGDNMKTNLRYFSLIILCILLIGCTRHIKPQKFDLDPHFLKPLRSNVPIQVLVPKNAETKYLIEFSGKQTKHANVYVDLNDLYNNAKELIEEVLVKYKVPLSPNSEKYLKFTISKVQWEVWAGGFSIGAYLEFDIETGDGYKRHYRVQDKSGVDVSRAVAGTTSRAVEEIFQDEKIIAYIELQ